MSVSLTSITDSLAVPASGTLYSAAVSMQGANGAQASFIVITLGGATSITPTLEGSNDLVNWNSVTAYSAISSTGFSAPSASTGIAWAYVRLKYVAAAGGTVIINAQLATALL